MTPRQAVLSRLAELAARPRYGVYSDQLHRVEAQIRLDLLRPRRQPDVGDRVPGLLVRGRRDGGGERWIPVDAIVTDDAKDGWGGFDYRRSVVGEIWAAAATAGDPVLRDAFLEEFGVVGVDELVFGPRRIYTPRGDGHHRIGAARLLELPFIRARVNESVWVGQELVVPPHFAAVRLLEAVWEACFRRGLVTTRPSRDEDRSIRIRVGAASLAPWALLRPDQAASIGLALQTHQPVEDPRLPTVDDLLSWRSWLAWLGVSEGLVGGVPLEAPQPKRSTFVRHALGGGPIRRS